MKRLLFLLALLPSLAFGQVLEVNAPAWLTLWTESGGTLTLSGNLVATTVSATSFTATAATGEVSIRTLTGAKTCLGTGETFCLTAGGGVIASTDGLRAPYFSGRDATSGGMVLQTYATVDASKSAFKLNGRNGAAGALTVGNLVLFQNNGTDVVSISPTGMLRIGIGNTAALATCDATTRNTIGVIEGGTGVTDTVYICLKAVADTYSWIVLATGG